MGDLTRAADVYLEAIERPLSSLQSELNIEMHESILRTHARGVEI